MYPLQCNSFNYFFIKFSSVELNSNEILVDVINGEGDGTVNLLSLKGCKHWNEEGKPTVTLKDFHKVDHMGMIKSEKIFNYLKKILS